MNFIIPKNQLPVIEKKFTIRRVLEKGILVKIRYSP